MLIKYQSFHQLRENMLLTEKESLLIQLLFGREAPEREAELHQELVIDDEKQSFLLLLARLSQGSKYAYVQDCVIPRLKGLLRYHSVTDKMKMQPVAALLDCLGDRTAMLIGNSAMYAYYDRENPRLMGIGDICIEPDKALEALHSAEAAGFHIQTESSLAALLNHETGNVNLHKLLHIPREQDIWERSETMRFRNYSVKIPECADALIILFYTQLRWYSILPQGTGNLKWYYDCACLLQRPDFPGWEALVQRAKTHGLVQTVRFMLSLFNESLPGWIPEDVWHLFAAEEKEKWIVPALNYGYMTIRYEAAKKQGLLSQMLWWLPWIRTKYYYINSEISGFELPISLAEMLCMHWGITSLHQAPKLFITRMKKGRG